MRAGSALTGYGLDALPSAVRKSILFRGSEVIKVPLKALVAPDVRQLQVLTRPELDATKNSEMLATPLPHEEFFLVYWKPKGKGGFFGMGNKSSSRKAIPISAIREVVRGANTSVFKQARKAGVSIPDSDQCFSVLTAERSLDCVCWSDEDALGWVTGLHALIAFVRDSSASSAAAAGKAGSAAAGAARMPPFAPSAPPAERDDDGDEEDEHTKRMRAYASGAASFRHNTSSSLPSSSSAAAAPPPAVPRLGHGDGGGDAPARRRRRGTSDSDSLGTTMTMTTTATAASTYNYGYNAGYDNSYLTSTSGSNRSSLSSSSFGSSSSSSVGGRAWSADAREKFFERTVFGYIDLGAECSPFSCGFSPGSTVCPTHSRSVSNSSNSGVDDLVFALEDGCSLELRTPAPIAGSSPLKAQQRPTKDGKNNNGRLTLLQYACKVGNHKAARLLLERGSEFDPDRNPLTDALALAVRGGHFLVVSEILTVADNTPKLTDQLLCAQRGIERANTLLHMACARHSLPIVKLLVRKCSHPLFMVNQPFSRTPLMTACLRRCRPMPDEKRRLADEPVAAGEDKAEEGVPCWTLELEEALLTMTELSARRSAASEAAAAAALKSRAGGSANATAVSPIPATLANKDVESLEDKVEELFTFAAKDHLAVLRELLEGKDSRDSNAEILDLPDDNGDTCLHLAAASGHAKVVRYLLESGGAVDVNAPNNDGDTPADAALKAYQDACKEVSEWTPPLRSPRDFGFGSSSSSSSSASPYGPNSHIAAAKRRALELLAEGFQGVIKTLADYGCVSVPSLPPLPVVPGAANHRPSATTANPNPNPSLSMASSAAVVDARRKPAAAAATAAALPPAPAPRLPPAVAAPAAATAAATTRPYTTATAGVGGGCSRRESVDEDAGEPEENLDDDDDDHDDDYYGEEESVRRFKTPGGPSATGASSVASRLALNAAVGGAIGVTPSPSGSSPKEGWVTAKKPEQGEGEEEGDTEELGMDNGVLAQGRGKARGAAPYGFNKGVGVAVPAANKASVTVTESDVERDLISPVRRAAANGGGGGGRLAAAAAAAGAAGAIATSQDPIAMTGTTSTHATAQGNVGDGSGDADTGETAEAAEAEWQQYVYALTQHGYLKPWTLAYDDTTYHCYYFSNEETGESAWTPPPEVLEGAYKHYYASSSSSSSQGSDAAASDHQQQTQAQAQAQSQAEGAGDALAATATTTAASATIASPSASSMMPAGFAAAAAAGRRPANFRSPVLSPLGKLSLVSPQKAIMQPPQATARAPTAATTAAVGAPADTSIASTAASASTSFSSSSLNSSLVSADDDTAVLSLPDNSDIGRSAVAMPSAPVLAQPAATQPVAIAAAAPSMPVPAPAPAAAVVAPPLVPGPAAAAPAAAPATAAVLSPSSAAPLPRKRIDFDGVVPSPASAAASATTSGAGAVPTYAASLGDEEPSSSAAAPTSVDEKWAKMVRMGVPLEAVCRKMEGEGLPRATVDELRRLVEEHTGKQGKPLSSFTLLAPAPASAPVPAPAPAAAAAPQQQQQQQRQEQGAGVDERFLKMIRMGVPAAAVCKRMEGEGVSPAVTAKLLKEVEAHVAKGEPASSFAKQPQKEEAPASARAAAAPAAAVVDPLLSLVDEKYCKMLKMGVPPIAVLKKFQSEMALTLSNVAAVAAAFEKAVAAHQAAGKPMSEFSLTASGAAGAGGSSSSSTSAPAPAPASAAELLSPEAVRKAAQDAVAADPSKFAKYERMKKMGVPLGAIRGQMGGDGLALEDIATFLKAHATQAALESMGLAIASPRGKQGSDAAGSKAAAAAGAGQQAAAAPSASTAAAATKESEEAANHTGPVTLKLHWQPLELPEEKLNRTIWGRLKDKKAAAAAQQAKGGAEDAELKDAATRSAEDASTAPPTLTINGNGGGGDEDAHVSLITSLFAAKPSAAVGAAGSAATLTSSTANKDGAFKPGDGKGSETPAAPAALVTTLDPRRANNLNIMLAAFKKIGDHAAICSAVYKLTSGPLKREELDKLTALIPKPDELRSVKQYKGEPSTLMECDRFFLAISKVPRFPAKIAAFITVLSFEDIAADIQRRAAIVKDACSQIVNSEPLQLVLGQVLNLGNILNKGSSRLTAQAITLDSLLKLSVTKASADKKISLMDALAMTIQPGAAAGTSSGSMGSTTATASGAGLSLSPVVIELDKELPLLGEAKRIEVGEVISDLKQLVAALQAVQREGEAEAVDLAREEEKEKAAAAGATAAAGAGAPGAGAVVATTAGSGAAGSAAAAANPAAARSNALAEMMAKRLQAAGGGAPAPPPIPGAAAPAKAAPIAAASASSNPCSKRDRSHFATELRSFAKAKTPLMHHLQAAVTAADAGLKEVAEFFGEDAAKATSNALFTPLQTFVSEFGLSTKRMLLAAAAAAKKNTGPSATGAGTTNLGASQRL